MSPEDRTSVRTKTPRIKGLRELRRWSSRLDVLIVVLATGIVVSRMEANSQYLATTIVIYALFALSVNVLVGWHGTMSFGQAAYFGGGAYFVAVLRNWNVDPVLLLLLAGVFGGLLALLFGFASIRAHGITFAMLTLVFGQGLYELVFTVDALNGDNGIPGVPSGELFGVQLGAPQAFWWYTVIVVGVCIAGLRRLHRSSFGQSVFATRDDPVRANALGIPVKSVRIVLVTIAGFFGAIAGGLSAQQQGIVSPDNLFWLASGNVLIMCLIGGIRHFWGPVLGAILFVWLNTKLFQDISYANLYVGVILLSVVLVFRGGLAGLPAQVSLWRRQLNQSLGGNRLKKRYGRGT